MIKLFRKKEPVNKVLYSMANGKSVAIEEVPDEVFSTKTICEKLYFVEQGMNESTDTALYVQPSVQGNSVIFPNTYNEETNLNLEVLFNAMLTEREKMQFLFNK